jgi:septal ring factor EnvC (AmiA/AmiB activator)
LNRRAAAFLAFALAAPAAADPPPQAGSSRAALLAEQQVAAAAKLFALEQATSGDVQQLAALEAARNIAATRLARAQATITRLLPVMQRLAAEPDASLLASPLGPRDAVRGITILQGIAAGIAEQARILRAETETIARLAAQQRAEQAALAQAVAAQQRADAALAAQIAAAQPAAMADADAAARKAAAALPRRISPAQAAARLTPPARTRTALLPGAGGPPVAGAIIDPYGAATPAGPADYVHYATPPGARVVTPCAGTVRYARVLPPYKLTALIDCGDNVTVILAGMVHLDVAAGQHLAHGQPVGSMRPYDPANPAYQPLLFVQLFQNGATVDPTAWLTAPSGT